MPAHMHTPGSYVELNPDEFLTADQLDEIREANRDDAAPLAPVILRNAAQAIDDRAALRDCPTGERSMGRCVEAFNTMFADAIARNNGRMTETQGWQFMELLKLARSVTGAHHLDDHVDRAAYAALAGEAAEAEATAADA